MLVKNTQCCGLGDTIIGTDTPQKYLHGLKRAMFNRGNAYGIPTKKAYYIFTDTDKSTRGKAIADEIIKHKLGTLECTKPKKNPNSGNKITVWVFGPDEKKLKEYCSESELKERIKEAELLKKKAEDSLKKAEEALKKLSSKK